MLFFNENLLNSILCPAPLDTSSVFGTRARNENDSGTSVTISIVHVDILF